VKSNDDSIAKHFQAVWMIILASSWVKTVVFYLSTTFVVWLIIKPSHIMDLTLR